MQKMRAMTCAIVVLLCSSSALATSFVVPSDDWLITRSDAIVTGTIVDESSAVGRQGLIETVYTLRIDEVLKGLEPDATELRFAELGGRYGDRVVRVAAAPRYEVGRRYLVFAREKAGRWTTFDFLIGQYAFRTDMAGEPVLVRGEHLSRRTTESGMLPTSSVRQASEFLTKVRTVAKRGATDDRKRMTSRSENEEAGDLRFAVQVGAANWSGDEGSAIQYSVSSQFASGNETGDDGEDRVIAGDPYDLIPGTLGEDSSVIAVAIYGCDGAGCQIFDDPQEGTRQIDITWADVLFNDVAEDVVLSQEMLNTVVTHEFGHTLGFRHSNRLKNDADPSATEYECSAPLPCSTKAVMTASADEDLNGSLTDWDREAANAVYGDGTRSRHSAAQFVDDLYHAGTGEWLPARRFDTNVAWRVQGVPCDPTRIDRQPESTTVSSRETATLRVDASGSVVEVRWYQGESGNLSKLVGTGSTLEVGPLTKSTSFWAQVTGGCTKLASETAWIYVRPPCPRDEFCALSDRFRISLEATDQRTGQSGRGVPKRENDVFGSFSLPELTGDSENPEVFVKVLDGREVNGRFWVFYGGLTDLDYVLMVTDIDTMQIRTYHKLAGSTAGGFDVGNGVTKETCASEVDGALLPAGNPSKADAGESELNLSGGRFGIDLVARDARTETKGAGKVIWQNDVSGYFALPSLTGDASIPEVFVKVLDGRSMNGHFWVFFSGLTDLEYTLTVTDKATGASKVYVKNAGSACGAFDTDAF